MKNLPVPELWPVLLLDNPHIAYPARINCAEELLSGAIKAGFGPRPVIWSEVEGQVQETTYLKLLEMVNRWAHALTEDMGLGERETRYCCAATAPSRWPPPCSRPSRPVSS